MAQSNYDIVADTQGKITADAIRGMIKDEFDELVAGLRREFDELYRRQLESIEVAKADGSPEAAVAANKGSNAVNDAKAAVEAVEADPSPEKAEAAVEAVDEAKNEVEKTESTLAERMSAAEGRLDDHETRITTLENGQKGLKASVEGLWVSVRANARAITYGTTAGFARIARITLAVLGIGVLVWLGIVLVSPVTLDTWGIGVGLACIAAGIVYLIMVAMHDGTGRGMPTQSQVLAEASADAGVDIVRVQH